ncbi:MAG: hypothetical protein ALECFALPRED_007001 [Alectoria fallacina]|uniref:PD-(D/E)XK nuclease-like domain-containing protein n=1 Tax=Alectoria fallacina TaxID=1903189 RepID=A0A8H3G524_9LECA|nr:MAG: hypothetical protein ALECFALPRED_007001 [Alectoria fallacina]
MAQVDDEKWGDYSEGVPIATSYYAPSPSDDVDHMKRTLKDLLETYESAIICNRNGKDENAWCFDVNYPLLKLHMNIENVGKWAVVPL